MRRLLLLFLLSPVALSAQEDCELFNLQELAEAYLTTQVDSIVLHLSNGNTQTLNFSNGLSIKFGCTDPAFDEYDPTAIVDDGSCESLPGCSANNVISMDGYSYAVVTIGDQCWFAENLRTTVYADGSAIPQVTDNTAWAGLSTGARCDYDNDATNVATYGRLYNWYAVEQGLCPTGWHVPNDGEWTDLENYINSQGFAGAEGTALRSTSGWDDSGPIAVAGGGNGTNDFGFSALPGGYRGTENSTVGVNDGYFVNAGFEGNWWSPNVFVDIFSGERFDPSFWELSSNSAAIVRGQAYVQDGKSVRCLRDAD